MKNNFKIKIVLLISVFTLLIVSCNKADASALLLKPSSTNFGIGEQFYVDVNLDTEGKTVNGVEGTISFSNDNIYFIRAEEGKSMVNLWVEKPNLKDNKIIFSGIMSNGFSGVIDPFNPKVRLPGLIIRLVFEAKKAGDFNIGTSNSDSTLNDGLGTIDNISDSNINLSVSNTDNKYIYNTKNDISPELSVYVTKNSDLYNNKYVLVFEAKDHQTGIKDVMVKEGNRKWKVATSPYLLEDQTRHSIITVQATNYSDSSMVLSIEGLPRNILSFRNIVVAIFFVFILLFIIKKIYEKYKKIHN